MEYLEAGKFLKKKRKEAGFKTQKSFIEALVKNDAEINCSESYISLIESGVKSPSLHLLDIMSIVLNLSSQEKGELLLIYKRVPNDFEIAVRSNLKEALRITNLETLRQRYESNPEPKNFNSLIRVLVLEEKSEEAIELLKKAPSFSLEIVDLQDRTAKIAAISGNYDFAIQAFNLALENCSDNFAHTKADILMNIGICYFNKGLKIQEGKSVESLDFCLKAKDYFEKSLAIWSDYIYCIDELARCDYHIGDILQYLYKNNLKIKLDKTKQSKIFEVFKEIIKNDEFKLTNLPKEFDKSFTNALKTYKKLLSHIEKGDLPEKSLKMAVYFHAYLYCKLKQFEEALVWINSINILDQNWLTYFLKCGYSLIKYEVEGKEDLLEDSLNNLVIAFEYEPETVKYIIKTEKDRELKTLWEKKNKELSNLLEAKDGDK